MQRTGPGVVLLRVRGDLLLLLDVFQSDVIEDLSNHLAEDSSIDLCGGLRAEHLAASKERGSASGVCNTHLRLVSAHYERDGETIEDECVDEWTEDLFVHNPACIPAFLRSRFPYWALREHAVEGEGFCARGDSALQAYWVLFDDLRCLSHHVVRRNCRALASRGCWQLFLRFLLLQWFAWWRWHFPRRLLHGRLRGKRGGRIHNHCDGVEVWSAHRCGGGESKTVLVM